MKLPLTLICALSVMAAARGQVSGLFNTGVNNSGAVLADGTSPDPHYTLTPIVNGPPSQIPDAVFTSAGGYPIGPWIGDDTLSAWIGPDDFQADGSAIEYIYTTTFTYSGNTALASISGLIAADDQTDNILLNNHSVGYGQTGFSQWSTFSVNQTNAAGDFVDGTNTLSFIVRNTGGPTGLRIEFAAAPDGTLGLALIAATFGFVVGLAPRRRVAAISVR